MFLSLVLLCFRETAVGHIISTRPYYLKSTLMPKLPLVTCWWIICDMCMIPNCILPKSTQWFWFPCATIFQISSLSYLSDGNSLSQLVFYSVILSLFLSILFPKKIVMIFLLIALRVHNLAHIRTDSIMGLMFFNFNRHKFDHNKFFLSTNLPLESQFDFSRSSPFYIRLRDVLKGKVISTQFVNNENFRYSSNIFIHSFTAISSYSQLSPLDFTRLCQLLFQTPKLIWNSVFVVAF